MREAFPKKGKREREREGKGQRRDREERKEEKRRKSNYSAGIIINSQLVPRNYSFEGHGSRERGLHGAKKEENGSFVEKLTTPPRILPLFLFLSSFLPSCIVVAVFLTRRTNNPTDRGTRR